MLKEVCVAACPFYRVRESIPFIDAGDIICFRNPLRGIGLKEGRKFLWFLMDEAKLPAFGTQEFGFFNGIWVKKRYNIPLNALGINIARANHHLDWYQPFFDSDPWTGLHRRIPTAINPPIVDKEGYFGSNIVVPAAWAA